MNTHWRSPSGSVCSRDNANDRSDVVSAIGCGLSRPVRQCRELLPVKLNPMVFARHVGQWGDGGGRGGSYFYYIFIQLIPINITIHFTATTATTSNGSEMKGLPNLVGSQPDGRHAVRKAVFFARGS
jgi:hypothetical protein